MRLLVELDIDSDEEAKIKYDFISTLIKDLKKSLINDMSILDFDKIEKIVLNFPVLWKLKKKPKTIDSKQIVEDIILSIKAYELKDNKFMIQIDKYAKLKNSNTSLETIAKVIDYGSPRSFTYKIFCKIF